MDNSNHKQKSHVVEAASDLMHEGKKWADEMCVEGQNKVNQVEQSLKECSDQMLVKVQKNPLTSVLVAVGVGFVLSKVLGK